MTQVLFLSYDGMTDPLGQSQVIPYIEGLSKLGYRFTLVSFEKAARFEKFSKEISARLQQSNIDWVPLAYTKKPPVLSTIYDLWRMHKKAFALHAEKNFSLVHCRSYIAAFVGLAMKKKFDTKFLFDMRGFYADERVDGKIWNLSNPLYKCIFNFFKQKEIDFLSEADYTISLTEAGKKILHARNEIPNQPIPIQVIPCCADLNLFSQNSVDEKLKAELRNKFQLTGNEFVLSYLGSIGTWYMLDEMLDFFQCLLEKKPDAKFLFITNETDESILSKAAKKNMPAHAFLISPAKHKEVPTFLSLSNWNLFFILPVFSKQASSPTKQGEIMGMGIPHICNAGVGDVASITEGLQAGILVREFSTIGYRDVIKKMMVDTSTFNSIAITKGADATYSLSKGVEKYAQVYEALIRGER
ncbi:MAG: glycosyltransferase [Bacteroidetes bacterium]|nr:glycosyltransferase [Bacteroidota bacterium]